MLEIFDKLLNALSSKGEMSIDDFYNIFSNVNASNSGRNSTDLRAERTKIIRILDALGHCEFDFKLRKVYVCPPMLVGLPSIGLPKTLLTGARSYALIQDLKKAVKNSQGAARIILQQQTHPLLPATLIIESSKQDEIAEIAKKINIGYSPKIAAWELINFAAGIDEVTTQFTEKQEPNWQSRIFSPTYLKFTNQEKDFDGTMLVEYTNPVTQQFEHWLWKGKLASEVSRDWGRYMSLADHGKNVFVHDRLYNILLVPEQVPLPNLFARALTLCSGIPPKKFFLKGKIKAKHLAGISFLLYSKVPVEIVDILAKKLSQVPIVIDIDSK